MDLKKRISSFLSQLLREYNLTQTDLASLLEVGTGNFSGYLKGKGTPRVEVIIKLADIGGITVDELLKSNKPPKKQEVEIKISGTGHNISGIVGGEVHGDVYQNTTVKRVYKYQYQPGDLTEQQAAKLQTLVNEIVELETRAKRKPKSHAAVWNALKRKFKVAYYRKIREEDYGKAEAYLRMWIGRLIKPATKNDSDLFRKKRYTAIFAATKNNLGWRKEDVDSYIFAQFGVPSIRDLNDGELDKLYIKIMSLKSSK